jgi:hypothetical protein
VVDDHYAVRMGEGGAAQEGGARRSRTEALQMSCSLAMARADGAPVAWVAGHMVLGQCFWPKVITSVPHRRGRSRARGRRHGEGAMLRERSDAMGEEEEKN